MNWLFWRPTPAQPVMKLSEIEQAILDDVAANPSKWRHREWQDHTLRSDRHGSGVSIITQVATGVASAGIAPVPVQTITAKCGEFDFGPEFAKQWHKVASDAASAVYRAEKKARADVLESQLRKVFVEG